MNAIPEEKERSFGQSVIYWGIIYAITIPVTFIVVGFIVRATLGSGM